MARRCRWASAGVLARRASPLIVPLRDDLRRHRPKSAARVGTTGSTASSQQPRCPASPDDCGHQGGGPGENAAWHRERTPARAPLTRWSTPSALSSRSRTLHRRSRKTSAATT